MTLRPFADLAAELAKAPASATASREDASPVYAVVKANYDVISGLRQAGTSWKAIAELAAASAELEGVSDPNLHKTIASYFHYITRSRAKKAPPAPAAPPPVAQRPAVAAGPTRTHSAGPAPMPSADPPPPRSPISIKKDDK